MYFNPEPYENYQGEVYSDHAPVLYSINKFLNIITWNMAKYSSASGSRSGSRSRSLEHKFNLQRPETPAEYINRLKKVARAISELRIMCVTSEGIPPIIFLQEMPEDHRHKDIFYSELSTYGLKNISSDIPSECGLIVNNENTEFVPHLSVYFQIDQLINRCMVYRSIGKKNFAGKYFYYVNLHLKYIPDPNPLEKISEIIANAANHLLANERVNIAAIYFVGDFNADIVGLELRLTTRIEDFQIYSLPRSYSLSDNHGTHNPANVDSIIKIEF